MGNSCAAGDEMALHSRCSLKLALTAWTTRPPVVTRCSELATNSFVNQLMGTRFVGRSSRLVLARLRVGRCQTIGSWWLISTKEPSTGH